ncbi:MAG: DUF262 domain-containing protein [Salinivirgaceae bacterium]|nr:DUF262 domain-containing protein [Salinivirgaceae bacterium]
MEQKLEIVNNWTLKKILNELQQGQIKIPRFQRDYVWEKSKVVKLLNSIYNQYPIGSVFFWKAPVEYSFFVRPINIEGINDALSTDDFHFILDGQQRILSLYVALYGKKMQDVDYSTICFNVERKEFCIPRTQKEKNNYPVWRIFNDEEFSSLLIELSKTDTKQARATLESLQHCREILLTYPASIVISSNKDIDDVVEIFERINQGGKHLTVFDLIHATTWSDKFDLKQNIDEFNTPQRVAQCGRFTERIFTLSLTLNAFNDARNLYQLKLTPSICAKVWPKTKQSLLKTIDFLKSMRINGDLTMYHNLLPILQYFFYRTNGTKEIDPVHRKALEKWFWDAKFSKRNATSPAQLKENIQWIIDLIGEE